jgi:CDP-4-dehydro-6-deoxyglucose reductase, E1
VIKLIKSSFYHEAETKKALADFILKQDIFSMSVECRKFEENFAAKQQRKHAVYVANGSVANLLLIQGLLNTGRLQKGDKVGFSALTWPTNVMPLIQLGLQPVAIDCELETLNASPEKLAVHISNIKCLFLTNVLGFCDKLPEIKVLCEKHNVILLEDNCESLGSEVGDTLLGNFGLASTFSFFVGHHMSTIEGGMVCTDDDELHDYLVMGRAHGWDRNLDPAAQSRLRSEAGVDEFYAKYTFYDLASNFRPSEINGFIGNMQIKFWDEIVSKRVNNFNRFREAMGKNDDFYQYDLPHMKVVSNFSMPVICRTPELAKQYREKFEGSGVETRPVIAGNMARQPFYKKYVKDIFPCPNSDLVHANGFYFGNNPEMTDEEINILCGLLAK